MAEKILTREPGVCQSLTVILAYMDATGHTKKSAQLDRWSAKALYPFFSGRIISDIKGGDIKGYIARRRGDGVGDHTIRRELSLFSTAINYCCRELEWDISNPVKSRNIPEPEGRIRWITRPQTESLITAASTSGKAPYLADFIRLAVHTGCRKGELLELDWHRVDMHRNLITLEAIHTKNSKRRFVPLNAVARGALINRLRLRAEQCPDSPWVFSRPDGTRLGNIRGSFATACRKAGIDDFHIHDLRHTCAAWLVTAGVPLPEIRDLLGHASITMTEKYAHLAPENIRMAVARIDGTLSENGQSGTPETEKRSEKSSLTACSTLEKMVGARRFELPTPSTPC